MTQQHYTFEHEVSADHDEMYWFFADVFKEHCAEHGLKPPTQLEEWFDLTVMMKAASDNGALIRFHNRYQRLIAVAFVLRAGDFEKNKRALVPVLAVYPDFWGQGVGMQLMEQVVAEAHNLGAMQIQAEVPDLFSNSKGFFERVGFEKDNEDQAIRYVYQIC